MATYYHVAGKGYQDGDALYSYDRQLEMGIAPEWKWGEDDEGLDTDLVCLFDTESDAQEFATEFVPEGSLLIVEIDDDEDRLQITVNDEGYTAVYNEIPAELIQIA